MGDVIFWTYLLIFISALFLEILLRLLMEVFCGKGAARLREVAADRSETVSNDSKQQLSEDFISFNSSRSAPALSTLAFLPSWEQKKALVTATCLHTSTIK